MSVVIYGWFVCVCVCVDRESRGGVLEPEGTVEIKYRMKDVVKTMSRLDPTYEQLQTKIKATNSPKEQKELEGKLKAREDTLSSIYHQIAVVFAELHDTPGRMLEKGCISVSFFLCGNTCTCTCGSNVYIFLVQTHFWLQDVLDWPTSRKTFYWRLKRRLAEEQALNEIMEADTYV